MIKINNKSYNKDFLKYDTGTEKWWRSSIIPDGWICEHGQTLQRSDFKQLWGFALDIDVVVTDEDWINDKMYGLFSDGDGINTFRLPDMRGLSFVGYEQGYHNNNGQYIQDQIKNITGDLNYIVDFNGSYSATNVYRRGGSSGAISGGGYGLSYFASSFDASRVVATGDRVQSRGVTVERIIKY